jgi:hypothetical protein
MDDDVLLTVIREALSHHGVLAGCFVLMLLNGSAQAASNRTVQDLYTDCKSTEAAKQVSCIRFIDGISSAMLISGQLSLINSLAWHRRQIYSTMGMCPEQSLTQGQMRQAFVNWVERNPKEWQKMEYEGVIAAMKETWPCRPS